MKREVREERLVKKMVPGKKGMGRRKGGGGGGGVIKGLWW